MDDPIRLGTCLACGQSDLDQYIDLGDQPLTNRLATSCCEVVPTCPLRVKFCLNCSHSQLSDASLPGEGSNMDSKKSMKNHFMGLASSLIPFISPIDDFSVLDIGCKDRETLFNQFIALGAKLTIGVDSWNRESPDEYDIITVINTLARTVNPLLLLRACRKSMHEASILAVELPYNKNSIKENQFDQFCHEHVNYFNVKSFSALASRAGLQIIDIKEFPLDGGSLCFILQKCEFLEEHDYVIDSYLEDEEDQKLDKIETYKAFAHRVKKNMEEFSMALNRDPRTQLAYAANAKAITAINYMNHLGLDFPPTFFMDDNQLKHGSFVPGAHAVISGTEYLTEGRHGFPGDELLIPIFSWDCVEEVKKRLSNTDYNITLITYVPEVRIIPI